ncbi:MAG: efflux RND transporter periplasmic adaptor subunit, partial [Bacteroidota bacterium]
SKERGERVVGTIQMEGSEILRIADLQNMEVNVEVNESDIVRVKMGDTALVEVDAYLDRKFKGLVTEIANSANVSAHNTDQVTTFNVKVRILRSSYVDLLDTANIHLSPFRPGMSATVDIQTATVQHVLSIPIQSVTTREDSTGLDSLAVPDDSSEEAELLVVVFAYEGGKVVRKEVKTGIQDSKYIQVLEGVSEDEEVVAGPYSLVSKELEDGDDVEKVRKDELYNRPEFKR